MSPRFHHFDRKVAGLAVVSSNGGIEESENSDACWPGSRYRRAKSRQGYFPLRVSLTVRFVRPLARRRARRRLPFFVAMRERNPCLFALLRRLGWYVRFIVLYLNILFSLVKACFGSQGGEKHRNLTGRVRYGMSLGCQRGPPTFTENRKAGRGYGTTCPLSFPMLTIGSWHTLLG